MMSSWKIGIAAAVALLLTLSADVSWSQNYEEVIHYHNDALGSPVAATDGNGDLLWSEEYAPYGSRLLYESREVDPQTGAQVESSWDEKQWFTGKLEETRTGLQYYGARWYEPEIGRFLSVDPVEFQPDNIFSFNRYAYANNNPYKYVDPDGRIAILAIPWVIGSLSALATGLELGSAGYGLYTGEISGSDLAGDIGKEIAVNTALKALPGGAAVGFANKLDVTKWGRKVVDAATPVGRRGSPLDVPRGTNSPARIGDRDYTGHALDQMQGRGVTPTVVNDTIKRGVESAGRDGARIFKTDQLKVILNPSGSVKTVITQ